MPDLPSGDLYALGVASGDPDETSVVLWTRLVTDPLAGDGFGGIPDAPVPVRWEVAGDEGFTQVVAAGTAVAERRFAHSVHAVADGLDPDTWYHYRFSVGDRTSPVGRTRTMPRGGDTPDEFTIAFASCQEFNSGRYAAYRHLASGDDAAVDLVFFLGDYIYEYGGGLIEPKVSHSEVSDLASYRVQYGGYKREPNLQAAHARFPWVVTWDDHEVENNYAAGTPSNPDEAAIFEERRTAAYQAYWEHMPLRAAPPQGTSLDLYRTVAVGKLATFHVLDGRQYRTDQVCGDRNPVDATACPERDDDANTMLGAEQEQWLTTQLKSDKAVWTVLAQQTVMSPLVLGTQVLNVDQWDGYTAARTRLFEAIDASDVDNTIVLTGDIHSAGAAPLFLGEGEDRHIVAEEFVGTSISSGTLAQSVLGEGAQGIVSQILPDAAYLNVKNNGYARCRISAQRWLTDFVIVADSQSVDSEVVVDATVEVRAGKTGVTRL